MYILKTTNVTFSSFYELADMDTQVTLGLAF